MKLCLHVCNFRELLSSDLLRNVVFKNNILNFRDGENFYYKGINISKSKFDRFLLLRIYHTSDFLNMSHKEIKSYIENYDTEIIFYLNEKEPENYDIKLISLKESLELLDEYNKETNSRYV